MFMVDKIHIDLPNIFCADLSPVATFIIVFDQFISGRRNVYFTWLTIAFHAAGNVHGAAPYIIGVFLFTYYTRYYWTYVNANSYIPWFQTFFLSLLIIFRNIMLYFKSRFYNF